MPFAALMFIPSLVQLSTRRPENINSEGFAVVFDGPRRHSGVQNSGKLFWLYGMNGPSTPLTMYAPAILRSSFASAKPTMFAAVIAAPIMLPG